MSEGKHSERCQEKMRGKGSWGGFNRVQCTRKAVKDGFCTQHHPDSKRARAEKQKEKWRAEQEQYKKKYAEEREKERLARAAPDLLAALERLLGNAISLNDAGDGWTEITADTEDVKFARAAIAQAKGEPKYE